MPVRLLKPLVFALCCTPAALLVWRGFHFSLGPNPVETITHGTGDWTLRLLLTTLAITPLRKLTGIPELIRFRRMLGLFAFFYATLHFATWFLLDKMLDPQEMLKDVWKRPFITAGALAFAAMIPLALTSTAGWIRRLGGKRWQTLHRLIYVSAVAGVVHFYWLVKSDVREPLMYAAILLVLFTARVAVSVRPSRRPTVRRPDPSSPQPVGASLPGGRESPSAPR
jgi:sulfoxide reductase heme-binding subunit YedZ